MAQILHAHALQGSPSVESLQRRIVSLSANLSAPDGLPADLATRLADAELECYFVGRPPAEQFGLHAIEPAADLITVNVYSEGPTLLLRHRSGVRFFLDIEGMEDMKVPVPRWIRNECVPVPLEAADFPERFAAGVEYLATRHADRPVVVILPLSRTVGSFGGRWALVRHQGIPAANPEAFEGLLARICAARPNVLVLDFDRILLDAVRESGRPPVSFFPYFTYNPGSSAAVRDLTHPSVQFLDRVLGTLIGYLRTRRTHERRGIRYLHRPLPGVAVRELFRASRRPATEADVREHLDSGDFARFCLGVNLAFREKLDLSAEIARRVTGSRTLREHKLIRNTMFAYIRRHPDPAFLWYVGDLFRQHVDELHEAGRLYQGKAQHALREIHDLLLERTSAAPPWVPVPDDEQPGRWSQLVDALVEQGERRIVLYPAGRHTRRLLKWLRKDGRVEVRGLLDDNAHGVHLDGLPVETPDRWTGKAGEAVVVSSDWHEPELYARIIGLLDPNVAVFRIYGGGRA